MTMLMQATLWDRLSVFDNHVYKLVSSFMSEGLTGFMKVISFIGSGWILTSSAILVLVVSLAYKNISSQGFTIALNLVLVSLLNNIIKVIIHRSRPEILRLVEISGYSFPSWHAMTAMGFFGFIIYLIFKYLKHWTKHIFTVVLGLLILTIGISRIYLGVHYASDVMGGYILGFLWVVLFIGLTNRFIFQKSI